MKTSELHMEEAQRIALAVNRRFAQQMNNPIDEGLVINCPSRPLDRDEFRFALGACQYPAGLLDVDLAYASYERLAQKLTDNSFQADALMLTGDQIYADATAGLFDPAQLDDNYRRSYERLLQKNQVGEVMRQLPVITMLDDHEIFDNYEPINADFYSLHADERTRNFEHAIRHYIKYQRGAGPYPENRFTELTGNQLWYSLEQSGLPVFVANSRTEREHRTADNISSARIMSESQFTALQNWLIKPELKDLPKLIMSPSIVLPRHTRIKHSDLYSDCDTPTNALLSDSWDGYPASLHELLIFIAENQIRHVVFLSGDEHLGCACRAEIKAAGTTDKVVTHSIHTSALYAPYPFANGRPANLMIEEEFSLHAAIDGQQAPSKYSCEVKADIYPGNGFTLLEFTRVKPDSWMMKCEFNRESETETQFYNTSLV